MKQFVFVIIFLLITLAVRFLFFFSHETIYNSGDKVTFSTTLLTSPTVSGRFQKIAANLPNSQNKIFVSLPIFPAVGYGQTLTLSGIIKQQKVGDATSGETTILLLQNPTAVISDTKNPILFVAAMLRKKIISLYDSTLPQPSASLLLGIVFGIKEGMPADFLKNLQDTGVLHVIAASGMNVTMVASFLSTFFAYAFKRQFAIFLSLSGVIFYAILSGLEPSILRAAFMSGLAFSAGIMGRQNASFVAIFFTGFALLFYDPGLIGDVGFQLSFGATLGILLIKPILDFFVNGRSLLQHIFSDDLTTTIAAQIATTPILLVTFGTYGLLSVLVNGLVLWTIPILMILGGIGAIIGLIFPFLAQVLLYLAYPFLLFFELVVQFFGSLHLIISLKSVSFAFIVSYYLFLMALIVSFRHRKQQEKTAT